MKSTKELAKELGILKRKPRLENITEKTEGIAQLFSYLVVLDFESTCWQNDKFKSQEIIEFPAVLLNLKTGEIESEFHSYVQPQENPILSQFCTELTGISQNQVDEGIPLFICLKKFAAWMTQQSKSKKFSFPPTVTDSNACFVTWSDWDLSVCLHYECKRKQLRRPPEMDYWIDLRATYRKFYNRRPKGLKGALQEVGILFEGREHSGLHDSRNTAMLVRKMALDGCKLQVTKSIQSSANITSLNNELWRSRALQNSSVKTVQQQEANELHHIRQPHPVDQHSPSEVIDKVEEVKNDIKDSWFEDDIDDSDLLLCSSFTEASSEIKNSKIYSDVDLNVFSEEFERDMDEVMLSVNLETSSSSPILTTDESNTPHPQKVDSSSVSLLPVIKIKNFSPKSREKLNFSSRVKHEDKSNKENMVFMADRNLRNNCFENSNINKALLTPIKTSIRPKLSVKNTPNSYLQNSSCNNVNNITLQQTPQSSSHLSPMFSNKTPGQNNSTSYNTPINSLRGSSTSSPFSTPVSFSSPSSLMSRTPPLCGCGCRTKRKFVRNGGPNHGRTFFSCSKRQGCKFFEWEFKESQRNINSSLDSLSSSFEISSSFVNLR